MGCLFEVIFEIFFEGIFELIVYFYINLMRLIVPNKTFSQKTKRVIKNTVTTIASLLLVILIIGLILLIQDDPFIKIIGKYMTYISLTIIVLQIAAGIIMKIANHLKK